MTPDSQDSLLSTPELVAHLWRRRWLVLLGPPLIAVATYLVIRFFGGETFEASAFVYLRDRPVDERNLNEVRTNWIDPPSYRDILAHG